MSQGNIFHSWQTTLAELQDELKELNQSSEDYFVAFGTKLQQFYFKAKEIATTSSTLVDSLAGNDIKAALASILDLLKKMERYLEKAKESSANNESSLVGMGGNIKQINLYLEDFKKITRTLHILGVSTKIENASVTTEKSDFNALSEEVKNLSFNIDDQINKINDQTRSLNNLVQTTLKEIIHLEHNQRGQANEIIEKLYNDIDFLSNKQITSANTMQIISRISDEIFNKMSVVISSVQFNDITRQQVEHVIEAFEDLTTDLKLQPEDEKTIGSTDLICKVDHVCDLQKAQLEQAKSTLSSAVEQIFISLRGIALDAHDVSNKVTGLTESGGVDDSSFLAKMSSDIEKISALLADSEKSNNEMVESILTVTKTIEKMVTALQEIEAIGNEIEMISVNVILRASNIGNQGAALAVMAGFIKSLSKDARQGINTISTTLKEISQSAKELNGTIEKDKKGQGAKFRIITKELGDLINTVYAWDDKMTLSLTTVTVETARLSTTIEKEIDSFDFHKRVKTVFERATSRLGGIKNAANSLVPNSGLMNRSKNLQKLEHKYTMESERDVHRSFREQEPVIVHLQTSEHTGGEEVFDEDTLGDNVELF